MNKLEEIIEYNFNNKNFLRQALTHPSFISNINPDYERLEFLGDSVLNLVITEYLINTYSYENEGDLAKRRSSLVSGNILAQIAVGIKIGEFMIMAEGEEAMGGRENPNNLENSLEALIAAIYLDGSLDTAKKFILKYWVPVAEEMKEVPLNPKNELQEWSQSIGKGIPEYVLISTTGPQHSPTFEIEVRVDGESSVRASGASKKVAEIRAAKLLLTRIGNHDS